MARETVAEREAREEQERTAALANPSAADAAAATDATVGDSDSMTVKVPKEVGDEIVFTRGVDEVGRFKVDGGSITAKDADERAMLLASVPGATLG